MEQLYEVVDSSLRGNVTCEDFDDNMATALLTTVQALQANSRRSSLDISSLKAGLVDQQRRLNTTHELVAAERKARLELQKQGDSMSEVSFA
jgi:hypothetical protein